MRFTLIAMTSVLLAFDAAAQQQGGGVILYGTVQPLERSVRPSFSARDVEEAQERLARLNEIGRLRNLAGALVGEGNDIISTAFDFANAPPNCLDAIGTYRLGPNGVTFSFIPGLPGEVNRFVIERADVDAYHARLHFMRGDCRLPMMISASTWYHYDWVPRPLLVLPARGPRR